MEVAEGCRDVLLHKLIITGHPILCFVGLIVQKVKLPDHEFHDPLVVASIRPVARLVIGGFQFRLAHVALLNFS